jgi:hypothetical protein
MKELRSWLVLSNILPSRMCTKTESEKESECVYVYVGGSIDPQPIQASHLHVLRTRTCMRLELSLSEE